MATIRISVMSIIALVVMISCILAISLFEYQAPTTTEPSPRSSLGHAYEVLLIVAIFLAGVVIVVTCINNASLTGKTYLIFAFTAFWLLIAAICYIMDGVVEPTQIVSLVFTVLGVLVCLFGTIFPFFWKRSET